MNRTEHNTTYNVNRLPQERVNCHTIGYGEFSQYDSLCVYCYLGHEHTWQEHDNEITKGVLRVQGGTFYTQIKATQ